MHPKISGIWSTSTPSPTSIACRGSHPGCGASQAKFLAIQGACETWPVTAVPTAVARAVALPACTAPQAC